MWIIYMIGSLFKNILLYLIYPFAWVLIPFFQKTKQKKHQGKLDTIIFVKRWTNPHFLHSYWKGYLENKGFDVYLTNFPIYKGTFEDSAMKLKGYIEERGIENATLVGISGGGVTALLYLEIFGGWKRTKKFISLGTPFNGSWVGNLLFLLPSARELIPGSKLVNEISSFKLKRVNDIYCYQAKFDEFTSRKSGYLKDTNRVIIDVYGHNNLHLATRETYDKIAETAGAD